ncbi:MAG: hypothetical protein JW780_00430 [Clostridiales bacterium]|nr:hypothetical protein [Clostridiales bacterium]
MASDQINRILEAEKKAAQIEKDARKQADDIAENARSRAVAERERTLRDASEKIRLLKDRFHAKDKEFIASMKAKSETDARKLRETASPNMDSAITATVDLITGKG